MDSNCENIEMLRMLQQNDTIKDNKIDLIQKQQVRNNTRIIDFDKDIDFLKTICLANLGFLITFLITLVGGMGFIIYELRNL